MRFFQCCLQPKPENKPLLKQSTPDLEYLTTNNRNHFKYNEGVFIKSNKRPFERNQILNEIKILSILKHNNITEVVKTVSTPLYAHIHMKRYLCDLLYWIYKSHSRLDTSEILEGIIKGLHFCHEIGVAHLDLKLENILIDNSTGKPVAKLTDFEFSKHYQSKKTLTNCNFSARIPVRGTRPYYDPALTLSAKKNFHFVRTNPFKCDLFALGVTLMLVIKSDYDTNLKPIFLPREKLEGYNDFSNHKETLRSETNELRKNTGSNTAITIERLLSYEGKHRGTTQDAVNNIKNIKNEIWPY